MEQLVVQLDVEGRVTDWNLVARRHFGYEETEIAGRSFDQLMSDVDCIEGRPQSMLRESALRGSVAFETWLVRKDGTEFWSSGVLIAVRDGRLRTESFLLVVADLTEWRESQHAERDQRAQLQFALSSANMGAWQLDLLQDALRGDERFNEILGLALQHGPAPFEEFTSLVHPMDRDRIQDDFERCKKGRSLDVEFRIIRPNGTVRWLHFWADVYGRGGQGPNSMAGIVLDVTNQKSAEEALYQIRENLERRVEDRTLKLRRTVEALEREVHKRRRLQESRKRVLRKLVTSQEDERKRLARELHDTLGQYVTAMNLGVQALKDRSPPDWKGREWAERLGDLANEIGRVVHRLAVELRPRSLDIGLESAVRQHLEAWMQDSGLECQFLAEGRETQDESPEIATTVYRIVQEALANVVRHADAKRVSVLISRQDGQLTAIVEDDGKGFRQDRASATKRLGLLGMKERAALVGGTLEVESNLGAGTTVYLRVPISVEHKVAEIEAAADASGDQT